MENEPLDTHGPDVILGDAPDRAEVLGAGRLLRAPGGGESEEVGVVTDGHHHPIARPEIVERAALGHGAQVGEADGQVPCDQDPFIAGDRHHAGLIHPHRVQIRGLHGGRQGTQSAHLIASPCDSGDLSR